MVFGRASGIIRCWPCHIAAISGSSPLMNGVEILGDGREPARALDEAQIGRKQEADRLLRPLRPADTPRH